MTKRLTRYLVLLPMTVMFLMPSATLAQTASQRQAVVCSLLNERHSTFSSLLLEKSAEYDKRIEAVGLATGVRQQQHSSAVDLTASEFDDKFQAWHRDYTDRTSDELKLQAAEEFMASLTSLAQNRRAAYDQARQEYKVSLKSLNDTRHSQAVDHIGKFQTSGEEAFSTAARQCSSAGEDLAQIRQEFVSSLSQARLDYGEYRRNQISYQDQVDELIRARQAKFLEARRVFEQGYHQILSEFRQVDEQT